MIEVFLNTKFTMTASAVFLGLMGVASQFLPTEILNSLGAESSSAALLIVQLAGALYLAFAILNWMGKNNLIGGVYSRPVSVGNLTHFAIGAITLIKLLFNENNTALIILTIFYAAFALLFAKIVFTHPVKEQV